ncbi:odorant receptor 22b-like [Myzus persicae]|uniref:odorant receptor 22b-like n=1 Tax=Myzus persicae TaxID=13164 RepID=UPI000B92FEB7|nr:odorant receptor 22b-like [Myzus persicae]UMT69227.1 odorant receptor 36 [Myzus persicae]
MEDFRDEEVVINLKLLKQYRFYHMLKFNETKILNCNVYRLILFLYGSIMTCMVVYGSIVLFVEMDDIISEADLFIVIFLTINFFFCVWRICTVLSKSNTICDLINVSRFNYLTSKHCCKHLNVLYDYRERTIKITNYFFVFSMIVLMQWIIFPILAITFKKSDFENIRSENVMNFRFPVSTHTYNQYFFIFYIMEVAIVTFPIYLIIVMDTLVLSFCCVIIAQQEVLSLAFRNIGHEENSQLEYYEDFKSVLGDQIQLNLKIKSYYSLMRNIILVQVAMSSTFFIMVAYVLIVVCFSKDSNQILTIIKLGSSVIFIGSEIFLYCYLFGSMNLKRESVNFSLYSCDWTKMDNKFKKLLLLTMRMNNANNLMIKASPKKVVDLQMFANVISIAYNVISVMLKSMDSNN